MMMPMIYVSMPWLIIMGGQECINAMDADKEQDADDEKEWGFPTA